MDSYITFTTEYAVEAYGKYYFVASEMNLVCTFEKHNKRIEIIGCIPEEEIFARRLCAKLLVWEGVLFIIPMNGKGVWLFYIEEKRWHKISIKYDYIQRKIRQAFVYQGCLFMIGCHYPAIICIDLKTEKIRYLDAPYKAVQKYYDVPDAMGFGYFRHDCVIKRNLLYCASFITNLVLVLDLDCFQWKYVNVGNAKNGYSGIAWDGHFFWMAPRKERFVVRWDGEKSYEEFLISKQERNDQPMYAGVVSMNKDVIFPAMGAKYTVKLHHGSISDCELEEKKYTFYRICENGEIIYCEGNDVITVLPEGEERFSISCRVSLESILEKLNITRKECGRLFRGKVNDIVFENELFHLDTLLLVLESKEEIGGGALALHRGDGIYGKTIWESCTK